MDTLSAKTKSIAFSAQTKIDLFTLLFINKIKIISVFNLVFNTYNR